MANVPDSTLELIYQDIVQSLGYRTTVGPLDKAKVIKRYAGQKTPLPSARLAKAAWRVAGALHPLVDVPPPPPEKKYAPQTYNKGSAGQDARYCTAGLPFVDGRFVDEMGCRYDEKGLEVDGRRTGDPVFGLKPADQMDGKEPCDPYGPYPPWPTASYGR